MNFKTLITTAGVGTHLGGLTEHTNNALVRIGKKPTLSYIIESYPKGTSFVVTVGHFADHIKDFISHTYPDLDVEFVEIDKYEGQGSSPGYSMLKAKNSLQCPFIYHAGDTIITSEVPSPDRNWVGGYKGGNTSHYASWNTINDKVLSYNDKEAIDFDYLHIGLVGIKDYEDFWSHLEAMYEEDPHDASLSDGRVILKMLKNKTDFGVVEFKTWFDMGNMDALVMAKEEVGEKFDNLDKVDESIFIFDDHVIKFFSDKKVASERVKRAEILGDLVPKIEKSAPNFYRYEYVEGDTYSRVATPVDFKSFLKWAKEKLWLESKEVEDEDFKKVCKEFYFDKTNQRIEKFFKLHPIKDETNIINGEEVPSIKEMLEMVDFDWLSDAEQKQFHGDFILENIVKTKDGYRLLDWRQNFGGLLKAGDMYYDLAKLNHNLTINHDIIHRNLFSVEVDKDIVKCEVLRKENLIACQKVLFDFIEKEGYDAQKVKMLTSIIWINMSPLHHHPFSEFLYYFGKLNLWRTIKEIKGQK